jgi:integrase
MPRPSPAVCPLDARGVNALSQPLLCWLACAPRSRARRLLRRAPRPRRCRADRLGVSGRSGRHRAHRARTFREVAQSYPSWLEDVKGAKPSTTADYRYLLAEPGVAYKRELVRVAAYAGLRQGEPLALRWSDVDFAGRALTVARALSLGIESAPKSGRVRRVPLPDQAAAALDRLSRREDFTTLEDRVFCNVLGRALDGSAVRKRFKRARDAAGLRPLRFHELRHTYGSLLAAAGIDLVSIQAVMGHSALSTTSRYLYARPASEQEAVFTRAFEPTASEALRA